ncbi:uncharacterized protein BP5553_05768 [Venustampulla echinocandica]|uniref:Uncharacterized protein n=1 Tax=Venustampulla echinocandica TaxID=2656787 RepID=A0A370TLK9_9HELO|nr:uncharacterized protein BP5553_05768 [Venustampulla echinocandica]RDL36416.1 hypothetical protein BP5553_05768 [Venustampulla echinocandica]
MQPELPTPRGPELTAVQATSPDSYQVLKAPQGSSGLNAQGSRSLAPFTGALGPCASAWVVINCQCSLCSAPLPTSRRHGLLMIRAFAANRPPTTAYHHELGALEATLRGFGGLTGEMGETG